MVDSAGRWRDLLPRPRLPPGSITPGDEAWVCCSGLVQQDETTQGDTYSQPSHKGRPVWQGIEARMPHYLQTMQCERKLQHCFGSTQEEKRVLNALLIKLRGSWKHSRHSTGSAVCNTSAAYVAQGQLPPASNVRAQFVCLKQAT